MLFKNPDLPEDDYFWDDPEHDLSAPKMNSSPVPMPGELPPDYRSGYVAVVGKPNVGKSTLINAYVGQKVSIISEKPQTTRRRVLGIRTTREAQIIFVDTPGIHHPLHKLGEYMVETAIRTLPDADVVLFMVDLSAPPSREDHEITTLLQETVRKPIILVLNKVDLLPPDEVDDRTSGYFALGDFQHRVMISATRGDNRDRLLSMIIERLPHGPQYFPADQFTDQSERIIAAELVREQALRFLQQEVPHSINVAIDEWKQRRSDLTYIGATIYVEKESQKGIVIGAGGSMLKRIGQAARAELEQFVGHQVFLDLWVKVQERWRRDDSALKYFGYTVPKD